MSPTIALCAVTRRPYAALPFDPSLFCLHDGGDRATESEALPAPSAPPARPAARRKARRLTASQLAALTLKPPRGQRPRYVRPTNDAMFKLLFGVPGQESFVAFVLEVLGVVDSPAKVVRFGNLALGGRPEEKSGVVDVLVEHEDGSETLIELQLKRQDDFRQRVVFYLVKRHTRGPTKAERYGDAKATRVLALLGHVDFPADSRVLRRFMLLDTETGELYDDRLSVTVCELTKHRRQSKRTVGNAPEGSPLRKALLDFLSAEDEATLEAAAAQHPMLMTAARRIAEHTDDTLAALAEHMAACDANSMRAQRAREAAELRAKQERAIAAARRAAERQGKLKGKAEGLAEGKLEAKRDIAATLLAQGLTREAVEAAVKTPLTDLGL